MATLKQRLHRKNSSGTYDVIYLETSSELVMRSDGSTTVEQALTTIESEMPNGASSVLITLTTSSWTEGTDGRYYQTVSVEGVTADTPVIFTDCALDGTDLDADAEVAAAWELPSANNVAQGDGTLTFYSYDLPTVNIPVNVGVC